MNRTLTYKNHLIILDGITGTIYPNNNINSEYIFKNRFIGYSQVEVIMRLKSFINLRLVQIEKEKHVDIYA
jgi:antitoxin component YwqK of YwqJK toxin-antitoxin module